MGGHSDGRPYASAFLEPRIAQRGRKAALGSSVTSVVSSLVTAAVKDFVRNWPRSVRYSPWRTLVLGL